MTEEHAKRLLKLADRLDAVPADQFDMHSWWHAPEGGWCGTAGCALGWAGTMPEFRRAGLETHTEDDQVFFTPKDQLDLDFVAGHPLLAREAGDAGGLEGYDAGMAFFGLTRSEALEAFSRDHVDDSPRGVARRLRLLAGEYHPGLAEGGE